MSRAFLSTRRLSQFQCDPARPDAIHARRVSPTRYAGTLAPSQTRAARSAARRSGGVVMTTYAAARPAAKSTTFAAVCAASRVISAAAQLRRDEEPRECSVDSLACDE